jgi:hypothetical protein
MTALWPFQVWRRHGQVVSLVDLARVLLALPGVEFARKVQGPAPLVGRLRVKGARRVARTKAQRRRLQATIAAVDGRLSGGGNCYRRALLEIALDRDAAAEPLFMGLTAAGGPKSGHAWLGSDAADSARRYDAIISL